MEKMMHAHLVQLHRILKLSDGCLRAAQDQPCAWSIAAKSQSRSKNSLALSLSLSLWSHEIVADGLNNSQLLFVAWDVDVFALACRETLPWSAHTDESSYERVTWVCLWLIGLGTTKCASELDMFSTIREDIYMYICIWVSNPKRLGRYDAAQRIAVQLLQNYAAVVAPEEDRVYKQHTKSLRFCCKRKSRARAAKSS
jgi:hypothetical protein